MERAARRLANGDAPITRIAFEAGYETHESFTRAFGELYAVAPSAFRQRASEARAACAGPLELERATRSGLRFPRGDSPLRLSKGNLVMDVEMKDLPELRVAAVRHVGPYNRISEAFQPLTVAPTFESRWRAPAAWIRYPEARRRS